MQLAGGNSFKEYTITLIVRQLSPSIPLASAWILYPRYNLFTLPRLVACRSGEPRSGFAKPHSTVSRLPPRSLAASVSCGLGLLPCDSLCINSGADNSDRNCPVFKCLTLVSWPQILSQQVNRPDTIDRPTHLAKITTQWIEPYRTLRSNSEWKSESHDSQVRRQAVGHQVYSGISTLSGQQATTHSTGQHI